MLITAETDYAVRAMLCLSKHAGVATLEELSTCAKIPKAFLSKVMQKLAAAGLVNSMKGRKGGFSLARHADKVNMLEIVLASLGKGPLLRVTCTKNSKPCPMRDGCTIHPVWERVAAQMSRELKAVQLSGL